MSSPVRRPVVLSIVLALLLGVTGTAAPTVLGAKPQPSATRVAGINVDGLTILQLQELMDRHRISSVQLTRFYLHRIKKLNPRLHAVIATNPRALAEARTADKARRRGSDLPLLGIPVLLKDNVNTTGMPTTAGSWALAGSRPTDAFIVKKLRAAGAVIIGKANLSEWANFRSIPSSSGWSGIGGQTNMAYALDRNPCGSSSGSGVAASANLATITVGTETDGSIVCPSGANGIVGIKPTLGLLSRAGVVPLSADQDTAGPMTRNVSDAAVMLGAMTGVDAKDPATAAQVGHSFTDYTGFLNKNAIAGKRIGVWRSGTYDPQGSPGVHGIVNATVNLLQSKGAAVVEVSVPIDAAYVPEFDALLCEFKTDIATYLQTYTAAGYPKTLKALIDFNKAHVNLEGPWGSEIFEMAEATGGRGTPSCNLARATAGAIARQSIDQTMAQFNLDAIIAPTNGPAWKTDPVNGDDFTNFVASSSPAAISGYADITVPAGFVGELPIGITFIGGRWDEPELIGLAYAFEQASMARRPPRFLASLN